MKEKVTAATVDNRAFELISSDGFRNLAQTIFTLGQYLYKVHNVSVLDLLPAPSTTTTKKVKITAEEFIQIYDSDKENDEVELF